MNLNLPVSVSRGPRKKLRGKRRRYRRARADAKSFELDGRGDGWFDQWHCHVDWYGRGNASARDRNFYVENLLLMMLRAASDLSGRGTRFQVFLSLDLGDASNDALFVNTGKSDGTGFPYRPSNVNWGDPRLENSFSTRLDGRPVRVGHMHWTDPDGELRHTVMVYSPALGTTLEG